MTLARVWRTVRHLSAEQWIYRAVCRGRRGWMRAFPGAARERIERAADRLPFPDAADPVLFAIAQIVHKLQRAVHGDDPAGASSGRFTLHNRDYDFGSVEAIDLRGEFHEGNNPLRRMTLSYMGYAVPLLARGRIDDLQAMARLVRRLEAANPFSVPGVFRDVWNPYAASHRLINLLCALALYRASNVERDAAAEEEIIGHTRFCAAFVAANLERDLQYNHLLKNLVALAVFSAACRVAPPEFGFLDNAVARAVRQSVLSDGGQAERAPMYHALALIDFEALAQSGVFSGATKALLQDALARMRRALSVMSHPDGDIALFNDSWIGEAPPAHDVAPLDGTSAVQRLPETGYVRIGRGGDAVIFDCGPCGPDDNPGHAHADFLAIEASIGGERFFVDSGVPTYTAGPERDLSRSAAAHNGPYLQGAEPIEFWKSFRVGARGYGNAIDHPGFAAAAPLHCAGRQDGYAPLGVDVRRFVGLWPDESMLICDLWRGVGDRVAALQFLIPDWWERDAGEDVFSAAGLRVHLNSLEGRIGVIGAGRWWPRFGVEQLAHRVSVEPVRREGGAYRSALWLCWSDGAAPPDAELLSRLFDDLAAAGDA